MKRIFVGSASADRVLAKTLADSLSVDGVVGECWTEAFPLGLLTFEALERMLRRCVGAVFIVSPDDGGRANENVLIEMGLVAGRMGRTKVALCVCGGVTLPSDLLAVTRIDIRSSPPDDAAMERLAGWAKTIPAILNSTPCTEVFHGYSGRWRVVLKFNEWRTHPVLDENVAVLNAGLLLEIPLCGHGGAGFLFGRLILHWKNAAGVPTERGYTGSFNVSASVSDVECHADGGMTFRTQTLARHAIIENGQDPFGGSVPEELAVPWLFTWTLRPRDSDPPLMDITFETDVSPDWSKGTGSAYREAIAGLL